MRGAAKIISLRGNDATELDVPTLVDDDANLLTETPADDREFDDPQYRSADIGLGRTSNVPWIRLIAVTMVLLVALGWLGVAIAQHVAPTAMPAVLSHTLAALNVAPAAPLILVAIGLLLFRTRGAPSLIRAARDSATEHPEFTLSSGTISLRDMAWGHGYEITGRDILDAYSAIMLAASAAGIQEAAIKERIRALVAAPQVREFVKNVLAKDLAT